MESVPQAGHVGGVSNPAERAPLTEEWSALRDEEMHEVASSDDCVSSDDDDALVSLSDSADTEDTDQDDSLDGEAEDLDRASDLDGSESADPQQQDALHAVDAGDAVDDDEDNVWAGDGDASDSRSETDSEIDSDWDDALTDDQPLSYIVPPPWAVLPSVIGRYVRVVARGRETLWRIDHRRYFTAGRGAPYVDFTETHPSVALQHALFANHEDGHVVVVDLGSRHGTFVRRGDAHWRLEPKVPQVLQDNDIVMLGMARSQYYVTIDAPGIAPLRPDDQAAVLELSDDVVSELTLYNTALNLSESWRLLEADKPGAHRHPRRALHWLDPSAPPVRAAGAPSASSPAMASAAQSPASAASLMSGSDSDDTTGARCPDRDADLLADHGGDGAPVFARSSSRKRRSACMSRPAPRSHKRARTGAIGAAGRRIHFCPGLVITEDHDWVGPTALAKRYIHLAAQALQVVKDSQNVADALSELSATSGNAKSLAALVPATRSGHAGGVLPLQQLSALMLKNDVFLSPLARLASSNGAGRASGKPDSDDCLAAAAAAATAVSTDDDDVVSDAGSELDGYQHPIDARSKAASAVAGLDAKVPSHEDSDASPPPTPAFDPLFRALEMSSTAPGSSAGSSVSQSSGVMDCPPSPPSFH